MREKGKEEMPNEGTRNIFRCEESYSEKLKKIINRYNSRNKDFEESLRGYSLALMSDLENANPTEKNVLYLEKDQNGNVHYKILSGQGEVYEGVIRLSELNAIANNRLEQLNNGNIESFKQIKTSILDITSERGHTPSKDWEAIIKIRKMKLSLLIACLVDIHRHLVAIHLQSNEDEDLKFVENNNDIFEGEKRKLASFYRQQIATAPSGESKTIEEMLKTLSAKVVMRPRPKPARRVEPPRINNENIPESDNAKKCRYWNYGLFTASLVTGIAGAYYIREGLKEGGSEIVKSAVEEARWKLYTNAASEIAQKIKFEEGNLIYPRLFSSVVLSAQAAISSVETVAEAAAKETSEKLIKQGVASLGISTITAASGAYSHYGNKAEESQSIQPQSSTP